MREIIWRHGGQRQSEFLDVSFIKYIDVKHQHAYMATPGMGVRICSWEG